MREWCMTVNTSSFQDEKIGSNPISRISLKLVETDVQKFNFQQIVKNYHSYKQNSIYVGRQLNFLIYDENKVIGCIGFGSYVLPEPKAFTQYIGWNKKQFNNNFNKVANNWRFTLMYKNKGYGSRVLSLCHKIVPEEWKKIYGDKLVLLTTFVGNGLYGTIYKASGWEYIGKTAGYGGKRNYRFADCKNGEKHKGGMLNFISEENKKDIFAKPLHRYWKKELTKES
jgi:hypothetical protein